MCCKYLCYFLKYNPNFHYMIPKYSINNWYVLLLEKQIIQKTYFSIYSLAIIEKLNYNFPKGLCFISNRSAYLSKERVLYRLITELPVSP